METVLFNDGPAHWSGFDDCKLIAAFTDLLKPYGEQAGIKSLLSIFGDSRAGEQGGKVALGEIRPCDRGGLIIHIRNVNAQISGDFEMHSKPVIDP